MKPPYIEVLQEYGSSLNAKNIFSLPSDTTFGNLTLKWVELVLRFEKVNDLIRLLYIGFDSLKEKMTTSSPISPVEHYQQKFYTEEIIYWLRKTADEVIGMTFILDYKKKHAKYPNKIKIDSIGSFLHIQNPFDGKLENYRDFLETLNEVSNGFKHSFVNSEILNYIGEEQPVVFALVLKHNDFKNAPAFHIVELRKILEKFAGLMEEIKEMFRLEYSV